ncbi:MAG: cold-shock protein [Gammaproteobacteria bacterium]|jgi:CspA family cold shock protein
MPTGTVNRFNKIKGYGFITADNDEAEIFVHFSEVEMAGYKELQTGQRISYECKTGDRGPYATNVKIIPD